MERVRAVLNSEPRTAKELAERAALPPFTVAGCLGALLGIGGGVFLVPFLNLVLGLPLNVASGVSLMAVIATST